MENYCEAGRKSQVEKEEKIGKQKLENQLQKRIKTIGLNEKKMYTRVVA